MTVKGPKRCSEEAAQHHGVTSTDASVSRDELDLSQLFRDHGPFIGRCIERLVGDAQEVDDLLQETFAIAYRNRARFDASRAEPGAWVYGIATNVCRHYRRARRRWSACMKRLRTAQSYELYRVEQPDRHLERRQNIESVYRAMQSLSFAQREVFALYELERMEGPAIAKLLKVPLGTVWTRLHHARKSFAKTMHRLTKGERRQ